MTGRDATATERVGGINVAFSVGSARSQSNSYSESNTARGSSVKAGGNINIRATGDGDNSNVVIQGSTVNAGNTVDLQADNKVQLLAAKNTASQTSSNTSSSGSVGVTMGSSGFGVTLAASQGKGNIDGKDTSYSNTRVEGNRVNIKSGGDTDIKGAVVKANTVVADVKGNLNIESLQDTSTYNEASKSLGGSVTIGAAPNLSINVSKTNINSKYANVAEQSGKGNIDGEDTRFYQRLFWSHAQIHLRRKKYYF